MLHMIMFSRWTSYHAAVAFAKHSSGNLFGNPDRLWAIRAQTVNTVVDWAMLFFLAILAALPASAQEHVYKPVRTPQHVTVNRKLPEDGLAPGESITATFSDEPTDQEIFSAHFFEEPLVPKEETASPGENVAFVDALTGFSQRTSPDDFTAINQFIKEFPKSRWQGALLANLGIVYRRTGYYNQAMEAWQQSWNLLKGETEPKVKILADRVVSELLLINAWVGRFEKMESLLKEIDHRVIEGPAVERITSAREAVWAMKNRPGVSFKCGPYAVNKLFTTLNNTKAFHEKLIAIESTSKGFSLTELKKMADDAGLDYQMAFRNPGAELILNAVVHWKLDHYSALLKKESGQYKCEDATMGTVYGQQFWLTPAALDSSASGYFLVPNKSLPRGWRKVSADEGSKIFGKGQEPPDRGGATSGGDKQKPDCDEEKSPMAQSNVHLAAVSLHIYDRPLYYTLPKGPSLVWDVDYHQRDSYQPANFTYANMGPKWTFKWLSYVQDDPDNPAANADVYLRGGGVKTFTGYDAATQGYAPQLQTNDVLARTCPTCYELRHPDGSKEIYARSDGSTLKGRKIFLTQQVDVAGNVMTASYDASLRITAIQDALGQVTILGYENPLDSYKITSVTDPFGRTATFGYDTLGRLTRITDMIGIVSSFQYDTGDFIHQMTTPYGVTRFIKEEGPRYFRALETHYPLGEKERVEYAEQAQAVGIRTTESIYPARSHMKIFNGGINVRNTFYWDKKAMLEAPGDYTKAQIYHWLHASVAMGGGIAPLLESVKYPLENRVWYNYQGQHSGTFAEWGMSAKPSIIGRVLDDSTSQFIQYTYNELGAVTSSTDPSGRQFTYIYAPNNIDLLEVRQTTKGANELLAEYTYNSQHLPLTAKDASGLTTMFTYNAAGQLLTVINPNRETTTLTYDAVGYLQHITGPVAGSRVSFTYDGFGRVRTITDSEDYIITKDYDALDRPTLVTYPDSTYEQIVYDRLDAVHTRDRLGRWSHTTFDALRRPNVIQDPQGHVTQLIWCACGSLSKIVDPLQQITSFTRDLQGRLKAKTFHDGKSISYAYENTSSRLKEMTDAKGQTTHYNYYVDDNLKQIDYFNASVPTPSVTFTYDSSYNRMATMTDGSGTTNYSFHPVTTLSQLGAGKLATVDGPLPNDVIAYTYDSLGREISRSIDEVASSVVFDTLGRVTSATNALGNFVYTYVNQTGKIASVQFPNGQSTVLDYFDNQGYERLRQIWHKASDGNTISKFDYEYNPEGRITKWTQQNGSARPVFYELGYDLADQLISATLKNQSTEDIVRRYAYQYDKAGNRTSEQIDNSVTSAEYNPLNQMTRQNDGGLMRFEGMLSEFSKVVIKNQNSLDSSFAMVDTTNTFEAFTKVVTGTNTIAITATDYSGNNNQQTSNYSINIGQGANNTISYDDNGNTIAATSPAVTYDWDAVDRLVKIINGADTTEFVYDGLGKRVAEKLNGIVIKHWIWCGTELCEERDASGGTSTKRFFPQGEQIGGTNYYYTRDHLGSIREMTDRSGVIMSRYEYDPYGRRTRVSGTIDADFGFTGHYYHQASRMHLALYRAYDTNLGRWLSRDPLENAILLEGPNLYIYVSSDPLNNIDLLGLQQCKPECEWNFNYVPPQCLDVTKPRDCKDEVKWCNRRKSLICSVAAARGGTSWGGLVGLACGLFYEDFICEDRQRECDAWNKNHGF